MYWAGGLHVFAPLPVPGAGSGLGALFRSHLFLNTGCVAFPGQNLQLRLGTYLS